MNSAVSLVQAYVRVKGYFTVTGYPAGDALRGPAAVRPITARRSSKS